jgi:hypothetical protein
MMKSLRLFKKRAIEGGLVVHNDLSQAMYLLPDGSMIDGEFDYGSRGQDHRAVFVAVDYPDYYEVSNTMELWDRLHKEYRLVRLVPESMTALIKGRQRLTPEQMNILAHSGYEIEKY